MPGTPAIQKRSRQLTRLTAFGGIAPSFFRDVRPSFAFSQGSGPGSWYYRLIKELWAFHGSRIAVRFAYEWHHDSGNWFRSYGNENWEFDGNGLMTRRLASINDLPIKDTDRKYFWPLGRRPDYHPGLSELDL